LVEVHVAFRSAETASGPNAQLSAEIIREKAALGIADSGTAAAYCWRNSSIVIPMFSQRTSWSLAPNAFSQALAAHHQAGSKLLDLTVSNPTQAGLQYDESAILNALADAAALVYAPSPKGLIAARQAVTEYYSAIFPPSEHFQVPSESMVLTASTSEAYSHLFRLLCNAGDEILAPTPSYPLFDFLADLQDVRLIPYSLFYDQGWHIDLHSVETVLSPRTRAILLVHPNNPTGSYVTVAEREWLNCIGKRHELALVADEVFLDYANHEDVSCHNTSASGAESAGRVPSFASNTDVLTFTLSGLSKLSGLPQMKLAWIVVSGPDDLAAQALSRLEVIADTYLSVSTPIQLAASRFLAGGPEIRRQLKQRLHANLKELDEQLARQSLCSRLRVEGGWYAILRVPATRSDEETAIELLRTTDVLVQPGYFYDFSTEGHLVLSLITPEAEFTEGIRRLIKFIGSF
jgi:hypothetical protein